MEKKHRTKTITGAASTCLILALALMTGCSHTIKRYGYELTGAKDAPADCDPEFFKEMPVDTGKYKVVGEIKLGDSGFSNKCHEDDAVEILKREACGLDADVVNITDETRANFFSTCYRAEAMFLKRRNIEVAANDDIIEIGRLDESDYELAADATSVSQRVGKDKQRNAILSVVGGVLGFVLGYALVGGF